MKLLLVVHYFLPRHQAGTEIYTASLAREFQRRGHEVLILTTEDGSPSPGRFALQKDSWQGLPVFRLLRGEPCSFRESYLDPELDSLFHDFLSQHRPDVVHFQHLFRLSAGMIPVCQAKGIPSVLTLADFWFICPPILLLKPRLELCPGPGTTPENCARCGNAVGVLYAGVPALLSSSSRPMIRQAGERAAAGLGIVISGAHRLKRRFPGPLVSGAQKLWRWWEILSPASAYQRRRRLIEERQETMKKALDAADLVLSPSRFLQGKMIEAGIIMPEKIVYSDYGFDPSSFEPSRPRRPGPPRFGFIGTPVMHKGVHVAVEAMNRLAAAEAELFIWGDLSWFPGYARQLRQLARHPGIRFQGPFEHDRIGEIIAEIDVLIVPSLWYENSPLTIHEAFLAGIPVLVSNLGGMAELVASGGGMTFTAGDPEDLARRMEELISRPERRGELMASIPRVKTIAENAAELEEIYTSLRL